MLSDLGSLYLTCINSPYYNKFLPAVFEEIIEKYHLRYNKENEHCEDYGLWIDISRVSNLMNIPEVLLKYRVHQKGYSKEHRDLGFSDAKKLHKKQIIAFGISPTADELRLHSAFFSEKNESTNNFLVKTESWFLKLHLSNMTAKIYNQQALEKILYERWRTVCGMNAKYGPIVWMTYRTSPLFKLGGWKKYWDSSKILVKCLLRRK